MQVKIFTGIRLTSDVRAALSESTLERITYEEKEYIGLYAPQDPTLQQIHELRDTIASMLHEHLPGHRHHILVFPQLFLG